MFSAILITGGLRGGDLKSAEIYHPSDKTSCSLDDELPEGRFWHTQDGPWACGGGVYRSSTETSCDKWSQGSWNRQSLVNDNRQSLRLTEERHAHVSWATASGLYLIGGAYSDYSGNTSELVKEDGTVEKGFPLEYDTM